ncbi:MAG: ABC transporter substrate-binding protein, partial [Alphaproteobacteria bacterium]
DQAKTDVGVKEVEKMLKSDRAQIIAGVPASNVMMAVAPMAFEARSIVVGTNAGPTPLAGAMCNPLFVSTSFANDLGAEATGELMTKDGIKTVDVMAPNYQAGKDNAAGFERTFKGKVVDTILFKLGETDFQADISKLRSLAPEAIMIFAPGASGPSFIKQWATSGMRERVRLYTLYTIINVTLPMIGDAAIGATQASHWNPDLANPKNQAFIKDFAAKHGQLPSFLAAQGYDAVALIASAVESVGGKVDDTLALARAMRSKPLPSVRGDLKYNVNGFPLQPYWKIEVVMGPQGKPIERGGEQVFARADSHWEKCPPNQRVQ